MKQDKPKKKKPNLGRVPLPNKPPKVETPASVYKRNRDKKVPEEDGQGEGSEERQPGL